MANEKLNSKPLKKIDAKKLWYHYLITNSLYIILTQFIAIMSILISKCTLDDLFKMWDHLKLNPVPITLCSSLVVTLSTIYYMSRTRKVYLMNFSCYKPDPSFMMSKELFLKKSRQTGIFTEESIEFQRKIVERSGLSQKTYFPPALLRVPAEPTMSDARKEVGMMMFGAIDELIAKTGVRSTDIGVLVLNCSMFNPTPSLSAAVVNHYKLRSNIVSYNLGGMGCSAGLISIELAKSLLEVDFAIVF